MVMDSLLRSSKATMKNKNFSIWYDEEGDYLEVTFKKSKDTYFNELKKDYAEIIDLKTKERVGYAIFNFTKGENKFLDLEIPPSKEITV